MSAGRSGALGPAGPPASPPLPLGVRNRLAELILGAFDDPAARRALEALAAFCRSEDGRVGEPRAASLATLPWFTRVAPDRVALRGAHRAQRGGLCRRGAAAAAALGGGGPVPQAGTPAGLLGRAALLANSGLYFEVHELLEPAWIRAEGAERVALQGLIQVAVAFHHAAHRNRDGAISLLTEGLAKLEAAGPALPVDTRAWRRDLAALLDAWRGGHEVAAVPAWPEPGGHAWHCS